MLLQMAPSLRFLKLSFRCVWPLQSFLDGRNVFSVKPVFIYCIQYMAVSCECSNELLSSIKYEEFRE